MVEQRSNAKRPNKPWQRIAYKLAIQGRVPYFKNRLYIPANDALKIKIAKGCHDSKVAGHFGMEKTIEIITRDFYWKGLTEWINDYVRLCDKCQHNKSP